MTVAYIEPKMKLFGHMDRLQQIKTTAKTSAPINVEIDLSNRCSLGCSWCHFSYTHVRGPLANKVPKPAGAIPGGDLMDVTLARSIIDQLAAAGVRSITWTGGGEPTLHPHFDAVIQYASGQVAQAIYTHGGHIDGFRAHLLKQHLEFVYVSLDAADKDSYLRDKGVDRFGAACMGVRRLVEAPGDATIGVGFLVTETNWRDIEAAADLVDELGAAYIQFRPTIAYTNDEPGVLAEETAWMDDALPVLERMADRPGVEVDLDRFRMYRDWTGHGYRTCFWSMLQTCITPNGKVWACVNRREHASAEIGDLSVEPFKVVWGRHVAAQVTGDCRVMCRGHLPNLAVTGILAPRPHMEFV